MTFFFNLNLAVEAETVIWAFTETETFTDLQTKNSVEFTATGRLELPKVTTGGSIASVPVSKGPTEQYRL